MNKIISILYVALAITTIGMMPLCLNASTHQTEYYCLAILVIFVTVVTIVWRKLAEKRNSKKITNLDEREEQMEINLYEDEELSGDDGGVDYKAINRFLKWMIMIFLTFCAVIAVFVGLAIYRGEIISSIIKNPIPASLSLMGLAIVIWLVMMQNRKEHQERRYANKILTDRGIEPLGE